MHGNRAYFAFNLFSCFLTAELLTYTFIFVKFLSSKPATGSAISISLMPIACTIAVSSLVWLLPAAILALTNCFLATESMEEAELFYRLLVPIFKLRIYPRKMLIECQAGLADCSFARKDYQTARDTYKQLLQGYGTEFSARYELVFKRFRLERSEALPTKEYKRFSAKHLREMMLLETATLALACLAILFVIQSVPNFDDEPSRQLSSKNVWSAGTE